MKFTKEQLEKEYQSGLSMKQIATKYNASTSVVFGAMKKYNIQSRPPSKAWLGKKMPSEVSAKLSAALKGKVFTEEHRKKISESKKGHKHPNFGKKRQHGKRCWYVCPNGETVSMRSQWEVWYAEHLKENNIDFKYEPDTFLLENGSAYTPDFLLVDSGVYVEVKGWLTAEHKNRISMFRTKYPEINLILADRTYLEKLGIDLKKKWIASKPQFPCEQCGNQFSKSYPAQRFCSVSCRNKFIANNKGLEKQVKEKYKRNYKGVQSGEQNNSSILTEKDVEEIFDMRASGMTLKTIAFIKNASISNIGNILKGRSWKSVYERRMT